MTLSRVVLRGVWGSVFRLGGCVSLAGHSLLWCPCAWMSITHLAHLRCSHSTVSFLVIVRGAEAECVWMRLGVCT